MERFYYNAEIEHITEIIKDNLYFAVLEANTNKLLRSTQDTYYFSTDEELVYRNYYCDFGPLNISCLYKYCYKLNSYLQRGQRFNRIVHYTTANPIRRANAAFLIGCYTIIYLKMEPKEIYHILLGTGGQFKPFVDASQGISHYTIKLLDCFQAIQKAVVFNFFNLSDFNVLEYDTFDKLQNGDMNWLIPRKFLAFIGPTDNDFVSGHPPEFYLRYFLNNDIKTIIRLNNKMYDASTFIRAGIDHHELFFPDGTVPSKQILLQFLEKAETARAAIAVHCKAGLGRTGSLIGAYIIKHYHLTAQEAISWMRICRPGSVIGQQQGWLEKIQSWLWRQGEQYRLHHFGDGDKMPHHKYGIYSKEWPIEREKLIKHIQRKRYEAQVASSSHSRTKTEDKSRREMPIAENIINKPSPSKISSLKNQNYQQSMISTEKDRAAKSSFSANCKNAYKTQLQDNIPDVRIRNRQTIYRDRNKEHRNSNQNRSEKLNNLKPLKYITAVPAYECWDPEIKNTLNYTDDFQGDRVPRTTIRRRNQSLPEEFDEKIRKCYNSDMQQTQGDKLNEIKARRCVVESRRFDENDTKQIKHRGRLNNLTNLDVIDRTRLPSKKKGLDAPST